ncbi:putative Ig domain-containing protein [Aliikangiella sp. IMCC44632]
MNILAKSFSQLFKPKFLLKLGACFSGIALVGIIVTLNLESPQQKHHSKLLASHLKNVKKQSQVAQTPEGPDQYFATKRFGNKPVFNSAALYTSAIEQKRAYLAQHRSFAAEPWESLGPNFVGGRTRSLVFHPENPETIYSAGVSGGVWKTLNAGESWFPISDDLENLAVVSLAIPPNNPNIIVAGTGEGVYVGRPIVRSRGVEGNGIYRSIDNGETWLPVSQTLNNAEFQFVNRIRAAQDGTLFAAAISGIWRSDDLGLEWSLVLDQRSRTGGCQEVEIQPTSSPNQLLAACGSFENGEVFKSSDNGETWSSVLAEPNQGRTTLAYAPSNPNKVYALSAQNQFGPYPYGVNGLYRSSDGGTNWVKVTDYNASNFNNRSLFSATNYVFDCSNTGQYQDGRIAGGGWYYNLLTVDPLDENRLWTGGLDLWRSVDGGENFELASFWWADEDEPSYIHGDHHLITFHPNYDGVTEKRVFATNDGGIWITENANATAASNNCNPNTSEIDWRSLNNNYAVTQFYHGSVSRDGKTMIGGSQDNGTQWRSESGEWERINGGDGSYSAIDPNDPNTVYVSSQYANLVRINIQDGDNVRVPISGNFDAPGLFITPFTLDPNDSSRIWLAGLALWRGDNQGENWSKVSTNEYNMDYINGLSAVAVQPGNSNLVITGGTDGTIYRHLSALSGNANSVMQNIKIADGYISSINFDRNNPQKVAATVSTFGQIHAWLSYDAGVTWNPIDQAGAAGLPDLPTHDIIIAPHDTNTLYVANDIGVYISQDDGLNWQPLTSGLPNAPTEKLVYVRHQLKSSLFAFTYGRGAFKTQLTDVVNLAPTLTSTISAQQLTQNEAISINLQAFFDDPNDDQLSFSSDSLPVGLMISETGLITGTPSEIGSSVALINVSDGELSLSSQVTINVVEAQEPPQSSSGGGGDFYLIWIMFLLFYTQKLARSRAKK